MPRRPQCVNPELLQIVEGIRDGIPEDSNKRFAWIKAHKSLKAHPDIIVSKDDLLALPAWGPATSERVWKAFRKLINGGVALEDEDDEDAGPSQTSSRGKGKTASKKKPGRPAKRYLDDIDDDDAVDPMDPLGDRPPAAKRHASGGTSYTLAASNETVIHTSIPRYEMPREYAARRDSVQPPMQAQPSVAGPSRARPAAPPLPTPPPTQTFSQPQSQSQPPANDPTGLNGFRFWYLDSQDRHVRSSDLAAIEFVIPRLLFKIEFPAAARSHNFVTEHVENIQNGKEGTYFGYIDSQVGDRIPQCPGFDAPQQAPAPPTMPLPGPSSSQETARAVPSASVRVAPVPRAQRESTVGGPSNSLLQAEFAQRKKTVGSLDPTRQVSNEVMKALTGAHLRRASGPATAAASSASSVGVRSSSPAAEDVHPLWGNSAPWASGSRLTNPDPPAPPTAPTPNPPKPATVARTNTLPVIDIPQPQAPPLHRSATFDQETRPQARKAPRVSHHVEAPRPLDQLEEHLQDSQPGRTPSSSQYDEYDRTDNSVYATSGPSYAQSFEPHVFRAGTYRIAMVLDNREDRGGNMDVIRVLERDGVQVEKRALAVGDVAWIAIKTHINQLPNECVLDVVLERKRVDDLWQSIQSGRFHEQKFRLKESGIGQVHYLVEHYHHKPISEDHKQSFETALSSTQVVDGFMVKETASLLESVNFLITMHRTLEKVHQGKDLYVIPSERIRRHSYSDLQRHLRTAQPSKVFLTTFEDFQALNAKTGLLTLRECWSRMLLCINGLSAEKVSAIIEQYDTPIKLWEALRDAEVVEEVARRRETAEQEEAAGNRKGKGRAKKSTVLPAKHMLTMMPGAKGRRKLGPALSEKIYDLFRAEAYTG